MNFLDREDNTIVAIATALNNARISIIRLSGKDALNIIYKIFKPKNVDKDIRKVKTHTIHYGYIVDKFIDKSNVNKNNDDNNTFDSIDNIVDEVLVSIMLGPKSYTAEDVVEINCHGGVTITKKVLDLCLKAGATLAEPGEFTKRAFLNGRIDLSQAEAVSDLINAKNDYAVKSSISQLSGNLQKKIIQLREIILKDIAFIEAALDDPEHIEIDGYIDVLNNNMIFTFDELKKLYKSAENGRIIKEGVNTVIVGKPNAGKSSFLNSIVGADRAIVTEIEGTTRDVLTEEINLGGILLNLVDTAGIRETEDLVEKIGVDKAKKYLDEADLVIYIVDASRELDENDNDIIERIKNKNVITLLNKTDLDTVVTKNDIQKKINCDIIEISAKENQGLDEFEELIEQKFYQGDMVYNDEICITNIRHKELIKAALDAIENVINGINASLPEDLFIIDMMSAYSSLGLIIGAEVEDDLVDKIFKEFCMGK